MPDKEFIIRNTKDDRVLVVTGPSLKEAIHRKRLKPEIWLEISQPYLLRLQERK